MPITFTYFSYGSMVYIHGWPAASASGRSISHGPTSSSADGNACSTTTSSTSGQDLSSWDPSSSSWTTLCLHVHHSTPKFTSSIHTGRPKSNKVGNFSHPTMLTTPQTTPKTPKSDKMNSDSKKDEQEQVSSKPSQKHSKDSKDHDSDKEHDVVSEQNEDICLKITREHLNLSGVQKLLG